jgi:ribosomal protein L11 methyltransferase
MMFRLTPTLIMRSRWHPYLTRPGERVLVLRAPGVFPPRHPTTRLCLELIRQTAALRPPARLADVGCGSGVLTLAAAALGVPWCVGLDLSRRAVVACRENAARNGLAEAVQVAQGSTECLRGPFEMLLANLPFPVLLDKAAEFSRLAAGTCRLILSGFRDTQEEELRDHYLTRGWSLQQRLTRDEWLHELPPEKSFTWAAWLLERT